MHVDVPENDVRFLRMFYIYIYIYICFTAIKLLSCQNHSESTRWSSKQVSKSIFARDIMYILYVANPKKIAVSHFSLFHFQFSHLLPMSIFGGDSQIPPLKAPKSTQINVPFDWLALMSAKGISWGKVLYNGLSSSVDFRCPQWWKCRMVIYIYIYVCILYIVYYIYIYPLVICYIAMENHHF